MKKPIYIILSLLLLAIVAVAAYFLFIPCKSPAPFDRKLWLEAKQSQDTTNFPRLAMADQLVKEKTLIGLTKPEVLDLLGDPGDHGYFKSYDLVYWLGRERNLAGIDSEWLAIKLGPDGKVVETKLVRD